MKDFLLIVIIHFSSCCDGQYDESPGESFSNSRSVPQLKWQSVKLDYFVPFFLFDSFGYYSRYKKQLSNGVTFGTVTEFLVHLPFAMYRSIKVFLFLF